MPEISTSSAPPAGAPNMAEYNAVAGAGGLLSGAATGAAIGSVVPVIGTTIGAVVGGVLGAVGGFGGGGGGASMQGPFGIAKRQAIIAGLVPAGKPGQEIFLQMLQQRDPRAIALYLQAGGNPNKKAFGGVGTSAIGAGFGAQPQLAPGLTVGEAATPSVVCDPRAAQLLVALVQAIQAERSLQGGFGPNPTGRTVIYG